MRAADLSGQRKRRYAARRRKRVQAAANDLTEAQWQQIVELWGGGCAYCSDHAEKLQKDCVQAISRGGRYTALNVVPACGSCNASKCNAEVTSWMRRKKLNERRFLERWANTLVLLRDPEQGATQVRA